MGQYHKLVKIAEQRYGLKIDLSNNSDEEVLEMLETIQDQKRSIIVEGFSVYVESKEYSRLLLVEGIVKMFLREIAPKRRKKIRK